MYAAVTQPDNAVEGSQDGAMHPARGGRGAIAFICLAWAVSILLVDPRGNFPVTDDWAFIESVHAMVREGELRFSDWGAMNLLSHVLWGSLFGALFGIDYTILRISTLVALLVGGLASYGLARAAGIERRIATLIALAAMFNPLAFSLAFSFMTDVPYMAMQMVALALIASGCRERARLRAALGWAFGIAALLCRQTGIAIGLGASAERMLRAGRNPRLIALALLPAIAFVVVQFAYQQWLLSTGTAPRLYGRQANDLLARLFADPAFIVREALFAVLWGYFYLGLLTLPLTVPLLPTLLSRVSGRLRLASILLLSGGAAAAVAVCVRYKMLFPMWGNTLQVGGLGGELGQLPQGAELHGPVMPELVRLLLTCLGAAGGALLIACVAALALDRWRSRRKPVTFDVPILALATALALFAPIMLTELRFDRYLIPIIPCLLVAVAAIAPASRRFSRGAFAIGSTLLAVMAAYSIAATHDFMEIKRVQWRAYSALARQVPPQTIDGGWVLNGQTSFGRFGKARHGDPKDVFGWYERADYMVGTQAPPPGYRTIAEHRVDRWLSWGQPSAPIYVQRREGPPVG